MSLSQEHRFKRWHLTHWENFRDDEYEIRESTELLQRTIKCNSDFYSKVCETSLSVPCIDDQRIRRSVTLWLSHTIHITTSLPLVGRHRELSGARLNFNTEKYNICTRQTSPTRLQVITSRKLERQRQINTSCYERI
jgi:hypothetical protein